MHEKDVRKTLAAEVGQTEVVLSFTDRIRNGDCGTRQIRVRLIRESTHVAIVIAA